MNEIEKIGRRIKAFRENMGINQTQAAKYLEVDQSYISKCENGERQISVDKLEKLCDLFGCRLNEFLSAEQIAPSLHLSFRADAIQENDLVTIAEIQRIALNIREMKELLEE